MDDVVQDRLIVVQADQLVRLDDLPDRQKEGALGVFADGGELFGRGGRRLLPQQEGVVAVAAGVLLEVVERVGQIDVPAEQVAEPFEHPLLGAVVGEQAADAREGERGGLAGAVDAVALFVLERALLADRLIDDLRHTGEAVGRLFVGVPREGRGKRRTQPGAEAAVAVVVEHLVIEHDHRDARGKVELPAAGAAGNFSERVEHAAPGGEGEVFSREGQVEQREEGEVVAEGQPGEGAVLPAELFAESAVDRLIGFVLADPQHAFEGLDVTKH